MPHLLHTFLAQHIHNPGLARRLGAPGAAALIFASQLYWATAIGRRLSGRMGRGAQWAVLSAAAVWFAVGLGLTLGVDTSPYSAVHISAAQAAIAAPFQIWLFGSAAAFLLIAPWRLVRRSLRKRYARRPATSIQAPLQLRAASRREFLRHAGGVAAAVTPFAVGAYGLTRGRLELETTYPRIQLEQLPEAFHGFRIVQLSDIHIGPFMTERQIRSVADEVNSLRPDLIVLTGDFVTWDSATETAAVAALSGLRAPFGIYGCLGNHELYTHVESSITRLFRAAGTTILRQAAALIESPAVGGGMPARMQLLGVDYTPTSGYSQEEAAQASVPGVNRLVEPGLINILLAHDPNCFDGAARLGIDLTISGHTHGGQIALLTPELSAARLATPYVAGHYRQGGSQLYVNRGLGTIGIPMRLFSPPEITVYELRSGRGSATQ